MSKLIYDEIGNENLNGKQFVLIIKDENRVLGVTIGDVLEIMSPAGFL